VNTARLHRKTVTKKHHVKEILKMKFGKQIAGTGTGRWTWQQKRNPDGNKW